MTSSDSENDGEIYGGYSVDDAAVTGVDQHGLGRLRGGVDAQDQ